MPTRDMERWTYLSGIPRMKISNMSNQLSSMYSLRISYVSYKEAENCYFLLVILLKMTWRFLRGSRSIWVHSCIGNADAGVSSIFFARRH